MKQTLLISYIFAPSTGGVQQYLAQICRRASSNGNTLVVLAHHTGASLEEETRFDGAQSYTIVRENFLGFRLWPKWFRAYLTARKLIKKYHIEEVWCGELLPTGIVALLLGKPFTIFTYARDVLMPRKKRRHRMLARLLFRRATRIVTISEYTKNLILFFGNFREKIIMLPPGVDADFFHPRKANASLRAQLGLEGKKIILQIGRLDRRKGFDTMIRLMPQISARVPNAHYLIVGKGPDEAYLRELIARTGVASRVTLVKDFIPDERIPAYYCACDVFVMLSRTDEQAGNVEGFGMVFTEANACEKPVIAGRSGGVPDAVRDGQTGFLVDPHDDLAIVARVNELLLDPQKSRAMGQAGRVWVKENFDWERLVGKLY